MIDFGYHNALQFEVNPSGITTVSYTKSNDFYNDPTNTQMSILTSDMQAHLEVYEITF